MSDAPPEPQQTRSEAAAERRADRASAIQATTGEGADRVAVILATGMAVAMVVFVAGLLVKDIIQGIPLSENATQILTGLFSGIIGALAGYMGVRSRNQNDPPGTGQG